MSHHSDDGMLTPTSDSFWEPGNYKKTTKRIEDSFRLCNDLMLLVAERSEIEKTYGKNLKGWARRWNEAIEKGPEYGTTEAAWKGALVEADRRCELHVKVRDRLLSEVQADIKQWQKDNYHKSMMQLKEKKEMDDLFKKAQKPWAKILAKVNKAKSDYHTSCKNERTATMQERNATSDSSISPDQIKKLQDRAQKCKEEVQKTRERFEASLQEINGYNAKYMEDMMQVFEKCQEMEEKRLKFFKRMLFNMHDCLNLANYSELPQMYEEYRHTIQNADSAKDLKWWSYNHGVGMAMNWPQFEEYSEEFRDIAGKSGNKRTNVADSSIMLLNQRPVGDEIPECGPDSKKSSRSEASVKSSVSINNRAEKKKDKDSQRDSVVSL